VNRFVDSTITFPYRRSLGPVTGAFMTALTEKRILGIRNGEQVLVPAMEWDPATGAALANDLVEVGPAGTVESWTWVTEPREGQPFDRPFAWALVGLDGADTPMMHALDVASPDDVSVGQRVRVVWAEQRTGAIGDFHFAPDTDDESEASS